MPKSYAFSIQISGDRATELQQEVASAFEQAGVAFPGDDAWEFEGPPEGAFGFGEGLLNLLADVWRELIKVPEAILALAQGIQKYLENRPNAVIELETAEGKKVKIRGNMDGPAIVEALKQL